MAEKLLIIGPSGKGKSHSIKNLNPAETFIFSPDKKRPPFAGSATMYQEIMGQSGGVLYSKSNYVETNILNDIRVNIRLISEKRPEIKTIIIDSITYAMLESVSKRRNEKGYDKFLDFAMEVYDLLTEIPILRKDLMVVIIAHEELELDGKGEKVRQFKVVAGKFTREKIVPEALCNVVLFANAGTADNKSAYWFETQTDGTNTAKSPAGMFPSFRIPNDLDYVIKSYWAYFNGTDMPEPIPMDPIIDKIDSTNF